MAQNNLIDTTQGKEPAEFTSASEGVTPPEQVVHQIDHVLDTELVSASGVENVDATTADDVESDISDDRAEASAAADDGDEALRSAPNSMGSETPQTPPTLSAKVQDEADDRSELEKQPYEYDHCTVQIAIQLLPDDGNPNGRRVVVGVRSHLDVPILRFIRLNELGPLPILVNTLLDELKGDLPAREQAVRAALEKARAEKEKRRVDAAKTQAQRRAERGRNRGVAQKTANATNAAKAPSGVVSVPTAPTTPRAPLPAATAMEQTRQMGLF